MFLIQSVAIEKAVHIATSGGNEVAEISEGWAKVRQVVHMRRPLTKSLRDALAVDTRLRHWSAEATPHNKAEEGFTDDNTRVAIVFPS